LDQTTNQHDKLFGQGIELFGGARGSRMPFCGSGAAVRPAEDHVCSAPQSRPKWLIGNRPLRDNCGLVRRSKTGLVIRLPRRRSFGAPSPLMPWSSPITGMMTL